MTAKAKFSITEVTMSDIMQPLRGVKVVDLTLAGSGPSCTKVLSEAGASVIWVESTRGTTTRSVHKYDFYCAGKQAISINLKSEGGRKFIELSSHVVLIAFEDDRCEPADYLQRLYWKRRKGLLVDLIGESHLELTKIHALFEHRTRAHDVLAVDHDIGITEVFELL